MIKKADILLFIILVIVGLSVSWFSIFDKTAGDTVRITVDGQLYGTYHLNRNQEVQVTSNGHTNHITIKDGTVSMSYSDCKNQICVNTGVASQAGDSIVCLPNKVVVEIVAAHNEGGVPDVISG